MQKKTIVSFVLSLIALFAMAAQNVPAVKTFALKATGIAHGAAPLVITVATREKPTVPSGSQTYQITETNGTGPHIVQATIDPPDVHVGDTQNFTVIVSSAEALDSVTAFVETDHGTTTIELRSAGLAQAGEVLPAQYVVNDAGDVVPVSKLASNSNDLFARLASALFGRPAISSAATIPSVKQYRYEGSWTVHDTHNVYYHTTFVAKDVTGKKDSVMLAWSDACSIPQSGAWTISAACTESSLDGVDRGNVTITNYTLTLNSPAQFAFTPGYTVTIGGTGKIVIATGASLVKGYLYYMDADGDGYPAASTLYFSTSSSWSQHVLRGSETHYSSIDCSDYDASSYQNWTEYRDADGDGYGNVYSSQSVCGGSSQPTSDSGYVWSQNDCYDSNSSAKPGQTAYFFTNRGDGSYDYNCDGYETQRYIGYNASFIGGSGSSCSSAGLLLGNCETAGCYGLISCNVSGPVSSYSVTCNGSASGSCGGSVMSTLSVSTALTGTYPSCSLTVDSEWSASVQCR